jgi:hypothetical protein
MFKPLQYDSGKTMLAPVANAQTIAKGDALIWSSGYIAVATSTTEDVFAIALEDSTTQTTGTPILVLPVVGIRFEADCDAVASIADIGTRCDLATVATLNPDATSEKVFLIDEIVGAAEVSTVVRGTFSRFTAT